MVATSGSKYIKIKIFPPLSFFTPLLYKILATAVANSPKMIAIIKSISVNLTRSKIPKGRNKYTKENCSHKAKNMSKLPASFKFNSLDTRLLLIFFLQKLSKELNFFFLFVS